MFSLSEGKYTGQIAKSQNVDGSIVSTTHYFAEEGNYDWHYHENSHISFVFQGEESEGSRQSNKKGANGISFYYAGEKHRWVSRTALSKSANIEIGSEFFKKYSLTETDIDEAIRNSLDTKFLMLKIQQELLLNDIDSFAAIQTLLLELFCYSKKVSDRSVPNWVLILSDLLNDNWNEQITLKELAQFADVHPITISKYFRRYFNSTLGEYRRKLKIDKSLALIKQQDLPLTDIAFMCGFADQSHFTRNFKQITGFLPNEFRKL